MEINTTGDFNIPKHLTDQNTLEILMESTNKMDTDQQQINTTKCDFYIKISNVISTIGAKVNQIYI